MRDRKLEPEKDAATLQAIYDKLDLYGNTKQPLATGEMTLIFSLGKAISEGWIKDAERITHKQIFEHSRNSTLECPICGTSIHRCYDFCRGCGAEILWGKESKGKE